MGATTPRKRFKWMTIIGGIIAIVILLFLLLPTVISSQWGKERALDMAAPRIPGAMSVDSWSLSWLGDQQIAGISYIDAASGVKVDTAEVTVQKGLISFLLDRGDIGTVTVSRPDIQISLPDPAAEDTAPGPPPKPSQTPAGEAEPRQPDAETVPGAAGVTLPPIRGHLVVQEGSVSIRYGNDAEPVASNINAEINILSLSDDIAYSLAFMSPDGAGKVSGDGKIALRQADTILGSLQLAGDLQIANWDISQMLDLTAQFTAAPAGGGILDGNVSFAGSAAERIDIDSTIDLSNLELAGGPLGEDRLFLEKTSVVFSAATNLDFVELSSLELSSPLAAGRLTAEVAADGALQFNTDLRVNLPAVAKQIPHTLNLQEGLHISDGILALEAKAHVAEGENQFSANALVEGLAGVRDTKKISLAEPFTFSLNGQQGKSGLILEHFSVQSSFLRGEGQGSLDDMQLSLQADLGAALNEISKFIALQDYHAAGLLALSIEAQRKDESTVGLTARLDADKLTLTQNKAVIIPQKPLLLEVDSDLLLSPDFVFGGAAEAKLTYQSWLGQGSLSGRDIMLGSDQTIQTIGEVAAGGQLKLDDLGVMLKSVGVLPETFELDGDSRFQFTVSGENRRFLVDDLVIDSPKLILQKGKNRLVPESALQIQGRSEVILGDDGGITTLDKPAISYQNWLGSGNIQAAALDVSTRKVHAITFAGKTDLSRLAALFTSLEILPPGLSFSGMETSSLKMDYSPEQIDLASLHTEIADFVFKQEGKTYVDKQLVIDAAGAVDMQKRQVSFSPVQIHSANGTAAFEELAVGDWNNLIDTLNSSGQARFDLTTVLGAVKDWGSLPADVSAAAAVDINWSADVLSDTEHRFRFSADLNGFNLEKAALQPFSDEQVSLQIDGVRDPSSDRVALDQFVVTSPLLDADAAGFWSTGLDQDTEINFNGDLAIDLDRVASLVRAFTDLDLEMAGKSERPFELDIKVSPEQRQKWWQHTDFRGAFQADLIKMLGVELRSLEIPIELVDGYAQAEINGSANQGALQLQPHVNLVSSPPVLTIPDNSLVIDEMQITRDMANQLLARIHPLFMGATQISGTVDLSLEHFSWPLGTENLNDLQFAGRMDLHNVRLDSSTLLGSLLKVLRVEETGLDLSGRQVQFVCTDGRIATNPLRTNLSDSELIISGSLGLDTTIDYLAQAEVTERLVGGDLYNYLEGTTINVPIGGTLSDPDISAQTVQRAVADLIKQAGQKKLQEAAGNLLKRLF